MKKIKLPLTREIIKGLKVGDEVLLSGMVYTARDQAHKRLDETIKNGKGLQINLKAQIIYYCGPTPAKQGQVIGSCGPTTSKRMDPYTPVLLAQGLAAIIGKGKRNREVRDAIKRYEAIYFIAIGGAGAYYATKVKSARPVAYKELGSEAIWRLDVEDFPVIVGIDSNGRSIFE